MTRRFKEWDQTLAKKLKNKEFAKEFILASVEEGISLQEILAKIIRLYGVKEFAEKVGLASSNVLRAISAQHNPTHATLTKLLQPFGLQLTVAPIVRSSRKRAA